MAFIVIRSFILYFVVIIAVRIMGKRQIGELQPSELVVTILISELASMPMQDPNQPILAGIIPILTLAATEILLSLITLKSVKSRSIIYGKPIIMIHNGSIDQYEMGKARISTDDLMEAMRISGVLNIEDVDYAILETNGRVSIIPKAEKQPLTPGDAGKQVAPNDMPKIIISDGHIISSNIPDGVSDEWLNTLIKTQGVKSHKDIFLLTRDSRGKTYIVKKEKRK